MYERKLHFGHVETFFRSFWTISIDMKKPYEFEVWVQKCVFKTKIKKYLICGLNQEISAWKLFFWKVQVLGYIFHIYHLCSKWILMELRAFEATCKIIVFYQNHLWKYYFRVHGKDSKYLLCSHVTLRIFIRERWKNSSISKF